jgi:hypothetical protein
MIRGIRAMNAASGCSIASMPSVPTAADRNGMKIGVEDQLGDVHSAALDGPVEPGAFEQLVDDLRHELRDDVADEQDDQEADELGDERGDCPRRGGPSRSRSSGSVPTC